MQNEQAVSQELMEGEQAVGRERMEIEHAVIREITLIRKRRRIFDYDAAYMGTVMILASFLGFAAENLARLVTQGIIDSRYMFLPFIGPYALVPLAIYLVLGIPDKIRFFGLKIFKNPTLKQKIISNIIYLLIVCLFVFLGELGVGLLYEKLSGLSLWDYTSFPLNFTKYTSLPTTLLYGGGAYLLMKFGFVPFMNMLQRKMNHKAAIIINFSLGSIITIDCIVMIILTIATKTPQIHWSIAFW